MDKIYTVPEVARYLKVSKSKMYRMVQLGLIPYVKIGRNVRIRERDLVKYIDSNCSKYALNKGSGAGHF